MHRVICILYTYYIHLIYILHLYCILCTHYTTYIHIIHINIYIYIYYINIHIKKSMYIYIHTISQLCSVDTCISHI